MLEDCLNPLPQLRRKIIEDEMRVYFRHGLQFFFYVVAEHQVLQPKIKGWTYWQMANYEAIRLSAVLVEQHNVTHAFPQR